MKKYNVVIVDDHSLFAQSLKGLIDSFEDFNVLYHASNGQELIEKLSAISKKPDIILMDVNMPVLNGIETMAWLKKNKVNINVLALSMDDDEKTIMKIIKNGASGYLLKDIHPKELEQALYEVLKDGFYYTKHVSKIVQESLSLPTKKKLISAKEEILLKLVCSDKTYKDIAEEMNLSPKTVDSYRDSLFKKTGVKTRVGLAIYAIKHGYYKV